MSESDSQLACWMLHVVTKTASQKLPRVRTRETEQTDECCIVSHKHRTSGSSSTYVTHDMVPRSLDHSTPLRQQDRRRTLFTRRKRCIAGEAACGGTKCAGKICWHNSDEWSLHGNNLSCLVMNLQPSSVCHFNSVQSARSTGTSGATSWAPFHAISALFVLKENALVVLHFVVGCNR
jgi:hypothetical protein